MDAKQALLKHFLAAIAYRTQKALRSAPDAFAEFRADANVRTPHELVWHMTGLLGYARTLFLGGVWQPDKLPSFGEEIRRFHEVLEDLGHLLEEKEFPREKISAEELLQGPLADAMTHVGQLAMLRRLASSPVPQKISFAQESPLLTWDRTSLRPLHPIQTGAPTCLLRPRAKACHRTGDLIWM